MAVEVQLETPLAEALARTIQPKLSELNWSSEDDFALNEYIMLMITGGKTQDAIAHELANDLLSLPPDDKTSTEFARWLFEQLDALNSQMNGQAAPIQAVPIIPTGPDISQGLSIKGASQHNTDGAASGAGLDDAMEGVQNGSMYGSQMRRRRFLLIIAQDRPDPNPCGMTHGLEGRGA